MSYDLVVFDPSTAPAGRSDFLEWYEQQSEESPEISAVSSPRLRAWFNEMLRAYPAMNGPHATEDLDNPKVTDYEFGPASIYMCFGWSQAEAARSDVVALARKHSVGFYDISDSQGVIWRPLQPGQFGVFYCFYGTDEEVSSDLPTSIDLEEIVTDLLPKLASDSDFLGIVDCNGMTLQFLYHEAEQRIRMEIPAPDERGSYGAYVSPVALRSVIQSLPGELSLSAFPELRFEPWNAPEPEKAWWQFWK